MPRATCGAQSPGAQPPSAVDGNASTSNSATSACLMWRLGWLSRTSRIFTRYCCLSHWARGDHTAGPRDVFKSRNWMPTASVTSPMIPPSASTSRTRWPLAIPPTAGLQDIWAIKSAFRVNRAVFSPRRAAAIAASHPACPAPTTTTSYCSVNLGISSPILQGTGSVPLTSAWFCRLEKLRDIMSSRTALRRKVVLPITIIRRTGQDKLLAHTLDFTETSARIGGLAALLEPGEIVDVQHGVVKARFQVFWMGAPGSAMAGQAGIRSLDPGKSIWGVPLATDVPDLTLDTQDMDGLGDSLTPVRNSELFPGENRWNPRYVCSGSASIKQQGVSYPVHAEVKDLSRGGIYLEMSTPLLVGSQVIVTANIEGISFVADGTVRTSYPLVGMGIVFTNLSSQNQEKIAQMID